MTASIAVNRVSSPWTQRDLESCQKVSVIRRKVKFIRTADSKQPRAARSDAEVRGYKPRKLYLNTLRTHKPCLHIHLTNSYSCIIKHCLLPALFVNCCIIDVVHTHHCWLYSLCETVTGTERTQLLLQLIRVSAHARCIRSASQQFKWQNIHYTKHLILIKQSCSRGCIWFIDRLIIYALVCAPPRSRSCTRLYYCHLGLCHF